MRQALDAPFSTTPSSLLLSLLNKYSSIYLSEQKARLPSPSVQSRKLQCFFSSEHHMWNLFSLLHTQKPSGIALDYVVHPCKFPFLLHPSFLFHQLYPTFFSLERKIPFTLLPHHTCQLTFTVKLWTHLHLAQTIVFLHSIANAHPCFLLQSSSYLEAPYNNSQSL